MFFMRLACTCGKTCELVWPPNASLYASWTCVHLRLLAGPVGPGLKLWGRSNAEGENADVRRCINFLPSVYPCKPPKPSVFTLNVNYIQLNYDSTYILHSILFNYDSVHICEISNKLGRVTSQSKVENKMAPRRTAAMIFTTILDLKAGREAKEASHHRAIKTVWFPQTTTCPPICSITHCNYFKQPQGGCLK